jgi:histidyl-tRNA synthetase
MHNLPQPVRLCYITPVFRYERPQAGRYREHHQLGVEAIGESDPALDVEVMDIANSLLHKVGAHFFLP